MNITLLGQGTDCTAIRDEWMGYKSQYEAGTMPRDFFDYQTSRLTSNPIPEHCPAFYSEVVGKKFTPTEDALRKIGAGVTLDTTPRSLPILPIVAALAALWLIK